MVAFTGVGQVWDGIPSPSIWKAARGSIPPGGRDEPASGTPPDRTSDGFAEFYAGHFTALTTQMYVYTGDLGLAQELVQEAFCRVLPRWSKISTYDDPVAWVRRVAFNLAKSRWQRAKVGMRFLRAQRETHVEGPGPERVAAVRALAQLPERHRRAMVLYYLADLPIAEIAAQERVAVGTVKSWLHRGRAAMAGLLSDEGAGNA
jgi:RNA polymerase sigma-70 factor (ECF subfamily)